MRTLVFALFLLAAKTQAAQHLDAALCASYLQVSARVRAEGAARGDLIYSLAQTVRFRHGLHSQEGMGADDKEALTDEWLKLLLSPAKRRAFSVNSRTVTPQSLAFLDEEIAGLIQDAQGERPVERMHGQLYPAKPLAELWHQVHDQYPYPQMAQSAFVTGLKLRRFHSIVSLGAMGLVGALSGHPLLAPAALGIVAGSGIAVRSLQTARSALDGGRFDDFSQSDRSQKTDWAFASFSAPFDPAVFNRLWHSTGEVSLTDRINVGIDPLRTLLQRRLHSKIGRSPIWVHLDAFTWYPSEEVGEETAIFVRGPKPRIVSTLAP